MIQFIRDLALLPAIWRRAAKAERSRRYWASPEGQERERQQFAQMLDRFAETGRWSGASAAREGDAP